jgi:anthranilate synthase component 1
MPFTGGWFVFLAYELAGEAEPRLDLIPHPVVPAAVALRIPVAVIRDHNTNRAFAIAEPGRESRLTELRADISLAAKQGDAHPATRGSRPTHGPVYEEAPERFLQAVERAKSHIAAGDVYQINLSRTWECELAPGTSPLGIYQRLRQTNPAPFGGLLRLGDTSLLCSSPERLLRVSAGRVETRPIAGTRPRLNPRDPEDPRRAELIAHPKERAEHVMLIDLERNDLGRICRRGTVQVDEFMSLESYAHVHHIVSNVSGELRADVTPSEALRAVFPGGTITGCPKIRCMQLIRELEGRSRGAYTGSIGYLNRDGSCDFNILIRTISIDGTHASFAAGSGIVADSDPARELDETRAKAKGLLLALQDEENGILANQR